MTKLIVAFRYFVISPNTSRMNKYIQNLSCWVW
jgi:hypothetical protein